MVILMKYIQKIFEVLNMGKKRNFVEEYEEIFDIFNRY